MRLDKYLKVSRLIKRRTVSKEVCDAGKVMINDRSAKAGAEVKVGDKITLSFGSKAIEVEVLIVAETMRAELAKDMYKVISETAK